MTTGGNEWIGTWNFTNDKTHILCEGLWYTTWNHDTVGSYEKIDYSILKLKSDELWLKEYHNSTGQLVYPVVMEYHFVPN